MNSFKATLRKVHRRLLPADLQQGILPYVWLVYLLIYIIPVLIRPVEPWVIWATLLSAAVFLVLYFYTFWQTGVTIWLCIFGVLSLGLMTVNFNPGASVFFVYAAAFCMLIKPKKYAFAMVFFIAGVAAIYSLIFSAPAYFYLPATIMTILVGLVNIYEMELKDKSKQLTISQDELRKAATTAERERIARDLHDVIGHTFSLINIKAQLAQKLIHKDPEQARQEVKELEQISRSAMAEVRQTVSRYHEKDMASEISKAKILAQSADIRLTSQTDELPQAGSLNSALALVIRELMTNITKHSNATQCRIEYQKHHGMHHLTISDNGKLANTSIKPGNGLRGIKERVEALRGTTSLTIDKGFCFSVALPDAALSDVTLPESSHRNES